ncbi:unnamed protein product [Schistosoma turkestanicum]|nr:unnamed protein product [Schistosoma turkestanicum]
MSGRRTQSESRITSDKSLSDSYGDSLDRDISFEHRHPLGKDIGNHVFHECEIYILKQIGLKKDEDFTRDKIQMLLDKYYNLKNTHCKLYMFEDSMRFERLKSMGRHSFHSELRYEDIKRCSTFRSKPQALALCVSNHFDDKRTYELFRCKSPTDINRIYNLIDKATQSNSFRLPHKLPIIYSDSIKQSPYMNNKNRAMSVESVRNSLLRPNSLVGDYSEYSKKTCDEAVGSWNATQLNEFKRTTLKDIKFDENENRNILKSTVQRVTSVPVEVNSTQASFREVTNESAVNSIKIDEIFNDYKLQKFNKLPRIRIDKNMTFPYKTWDDSITYLQIHPIYGPQISERGPVYMYAIQL